MRCVRSIAFAVALAAVALIAVQGSLGGPVTWTPDGLFYHARTLEFRGESQQAALDQAFNGPYGAELRQIDPERSGDPSWVAYNAQFYERRVLVPLAALALAPVVGERALLDLSLAGYVAAILGLYGLLLLRFRPVVAGAVALATAIMPALTRHSAFPLTDSWGLALEIGAIACGILALDQGPKWIVPWTFAVLVLSFTRDSMWIPVLAALWLAVSQRSRVAVMLAVSGVAACIPVLLMFEVPLRDLLATMFNNSQPLADPSWEFVAEHYPGAVFDLVHANGGFVLDGEWYSAIYLGAGLVLLFALSMGGRGTPVTSFMKAATAAAVAYVLAVPIFSAFRLELVLIPMAAFGVALVVERVVEGITLPSERASRQPRGGPPDRAPPPRGSSLAESLDSGV